MVHNEFERVLESVVGPAPWYWKTFPVLETGGKTFLWNFLGQKGPLADLVTLHEKEKQEPLLILNTYVRPFHANGGFLGLWYPVHDQKELHITFLDLAHLRPIDRFEETAMNFRNSRTLLLYSSPVAEKIKIPEGLPAGDHKISSSKCASELPELLMLVSNSTDSRQSDSVPAMSIYSWQPATGDLKVLPQKWFTGRTMDLGYQWITRVARNPADSRLIGDGIRIPPFALNNDGTDLETGDDA